MKGDPEFVILKHTAWLPAPEWEDRILGSVIRHPLKPSNDLVPDTPLVYNTQPFHEGQFSDFVLSNSKSQGHSVSPELTNLAGISFQGNTDAAVHLSGRHLRYRRLTQHSKYWAKLLSDKDVASTVPGWISPWNDWPPCLVVGIMIATAVEVDTSGSKSRERGGNLQLPLATIALGAAGVPLPPGLLPEIADPSIEASRTKTTARVFKATVPDERIFALELRIVTTKLLRRKELKLKEGGPAFDEGSIHDGRADSSDEEEEEPPVEDLVLETFTAKEYGQMASV
ncbi:hypothetical protein F5X68DRAFT_226744 [Plectosphaerella plurivora]|uniref:Uncharacterized protein n=1 Tax=Plectosphaerella plurivora TaxID=936078 RepID=A0A9P8VKR4_9PEZI|nr:hypothetical protein F5X68DRAFT_226744 [Plectosphaerella plurivora]